MFIPKLKTVLTTFAQFVAVMIPVIGFLSWAYATLDAKAEEYVNMVVDKRFDDLEVELNSLSASIRTLIRGQTVETNQSEEEARINRQILCLQELQLDPSSGTLEACQAGE